MAGGRGASDRVARSHAQTRPTLRLALVFIAAVPVAAALASSRWLAVHLFMAGAVVLAISGVSLMLTVTWSAAPAPPHRWVALQRTLIAAGAAGVGIGRETELPDAVVGAAGGLYLTGLVILGGLLVVTVRRGVERRFDVAVAAYLAALGAGVMGVTIGIAMGVNSPSPQARAVHVTSAVLGLVGLVVGGTLPFFVGTVGRSKMSAHATRGRLAVALGWQVATLGLAIVSLAVHAPIWAAVGLGGYAAGIVAMFTSLPRPTRRQARWAGPRLAAIWAGVAWWAVAVAASAVDVGHDRVVFGGRWLLVLVVGGYAQILWGSLAYLLPMLRGGGHERLTEGFATTRSWPGFALANLAAVSAALSLPALVTVAAVAVWALDSAWRAIRVGTTPAVRPTAGP